MRTKVTHVIPVFKPGGAELQLATLARTQAARDDDVVVWCLTADPVLSSELADAGVAIVSLRTAGLKRWIAAARAARRGAVVHSWMYHGFLMGASLRPFGNAKHVWGVRRTEPFSAGLKRRTRLIVKLGRSLAPYATDGLVFCSETTMARHKDAGFRSSVLAVTLNSLPTRFLEPRPSEGGRQFTVGCLTRWTYDKGIDVLLKAWSDFIAAGGEGVLLLAGPGITSSNRPLTSMIEAAGVSPSVSLLGPFRDAREFHRLLDVYVSPSRTEGFPNVVAEAMGTRLAVIATDVGGTSEVTGDAAILVANEDHGAVSEALSRLYSDDRLRHDLGKRAHDRCADLFTPERTEAAVRSVYRTIGAEVT